MRKIIASSLALLLIATFSFAQTRNPENDDPGKSNFGNIGVQGLDTTGSAGFIEMKAVNDAGEEKLYYLWVEVTNDGTGDLYVASRETLDDLASFPSGDWRTFGGSTGTEKVGGQ